MHKQVEKKELFNSTTTTNGHDSKFINRLKQMLAGKLVNDPKSFSQDHKKLSCNSNSVKTAINDLKSEEIIVTDKKFSNVMNNEDKKPGKKKNTKRKKNQVDPENYVEQTNDESIEKILLKQNVREKRRKIETAKKRRRDLNLKKEKTSLKEKRVRRKKSVPINSSLLFDARNYDSDSGDSLSANENERRKKPVALVDKKIQFGDPTMIEGTPKVLSKMAVYNSPVYNLNATSMLHSQGNILGNFFSCDKKNANPAIFQSAKMTTQTSDDDSIEETDDLKTNDTESMHKNRENLDDASDISLITDDEMSDSNFCSNHTGNKLASALRVSKESENDLKERPEFYSFHNKVVTFMGPSCKFHFNGKLRVKVLIGRVEIYGFIFSKSETVVPAEIYSPRGSSLVCIETVSRCESGDETDTENLYSLLINEGIHENLARELDNKLNDSFDNQTVLILENLENTLTKYLDFYYPFKLFPKIEDQTNYHNQHPKKAEKLLQMTIQYNEDLGKRLKKDYYRDSNILNKILNSASTNNSQRILIAGGKGVGKSTTLRYFVNGLLPTQKEIVVVDFDPGQPEFTPPGCISLNIINRPLTGPNYTHLKTPFYQIFIGDVNVARCIPRYVEAARKLVDYLNESPRLKDRIVLVNTMGFCTGIGWDLMVYIIKLIHPTTVVQISSDRSKNNFRYLLSSEVIDHQSPSHFTGGESEMSLWETPCDHELYVVPSLSEGKAKFGDFWEMEPRQQRDITLLAYLSKIPKDDQEDDKLLFSPLPRINNRIPYSIQMSNLTISLIRNIVPASHILATMNGNIVALCGIDIANETLDPDAATDIYPKTLLRAPISTCYGFGIVRGVDMAKGNIFINTPLSMDNLKHVNCLIGSIPMPTVLISSDSLNAPYVGVGADLPTSREPRRGYFRLRQRNNNS